MQACVFSFNGWTTGYGNNNDGEESGEAHQVVSEILQHLGDKAFFLFCGNCYGLGMI